MNGRRLFDETKCFPNDKRLLQGPLLLYCGKMSPKGEEAIYRRENESAWPFFRYKKARTSCQEEPVVGEPVIGFLYVK